MGYEVSAQSFTLRKIPGLPTNEVYDLLVDRQGLLWIGHDYGLSSFDGKTFKHYSNNKQASLAVSDLVEDSEGKIWCHNFSGQIFYIERGRMNLLTQFDYKKETSFPRIVIWKNQLLATSSRGLFIYDIKKKKAKYIIYPNTFGSLAATKNGVIIGGRDYWYLYSGGNRFYKVHFTPELTSRAYNVISISPQSKGDTVYVLVNPDAKCVRLKVEDKKINVIDEIKVPDFVNTISIVNNEQWIHSKITSLHIDKRDSISGYDLTDIVKDREGNQWYSSLKHGLMVKYTDEFKKVNPALSLPTGDYIKTVFTDNKKLVLGTHAGRIFTKDLQNGAVRKIELPNGFGAVELIFHYDKSNILICTSVGLFLFNFNSFKLTQLSAYCVVKDIDVNKDFIAIATATALLISPSDILQKLDRSYYPTLRKKLPGLYQMTSTEGLFPLLMKRCKSVSYAQFNNSLLCSFKDGLFRFTKKGCESVLFNGEVVNSNSLLTYPSKIFIGTLSKGLLVYDKNGIRNTKNNELLFPGPILRLKNLNDKLCILGSNGIQLFDPETENVIASYSLPDINPGNVLDIDEVNGHVWMTTIDGIFELPKVRQRKVLPNINLQYTIVNGSDTLTNDSLPLQHNQSSIRFYYQVPWYSNSESMHIAYRLLGSSDTSWQYTANTDQPISFIALKPGVYTLDAKAINTAENIESPIQSYSFTIEKPWWLKTPYLILEITTLLILISLSIRRYFINRLRQQKSFFEKELAIQQERQRISADIHDDLGASLSGIRMMAEMAKRKNERQEKVSSDLQDIHSNVSLLSQKMREVIWSLNSENDTLENLLGYLHRRGIELFADGSIHFRSSLPEIIPHIILNGEKRRHIYLITKEALHNALKHAQCTAIKLNISIIGDMLIIQIHDDGIGFIPSEIIDGNGLKNMQKRVATLDGKIKIKNKNGTYVSIEIPI